MSTEHDAGFTAQKNRLIAEGQLYRVGIVHSKIHVAQALHPQALLNGVVNHAVGYANARLDNVLAPGGLSLQMAMPYLLAGLSFLGRRKLMKPVLGVSLAGAAFAWAWLARRKRG